MKYLFRRAVLLSLILSLCAGAACAAELTVPKGTKVIKEKAFYGNASLDQVVLPDGLMTIGSQAFKESSLKSVNLPGSLASIADDAFDTGDLDKNVFTVDDKSSYAAGWLNRIYGDLDVKSLSAEQLDTLKISIELSDEPQDGSVYYSVKNGGTSIEGFNKEVQISSAETNYSYTSGLQAGTYTLHVFRKINGSDMGLATVTFTVR